MTASTIMFSSDLFFGSKVTGTATAMGLHVELEADIGRGLSKLEGGGYRCVILDLAMQGLSPADVIAAVNNSSATDRPHVIAFGSQQLQAFIGREFAGMFQHSFDIDVDTADGKLGMQLPDVRKANKNDHQRGTAGETSYGHGMRSF